MASEALDSGHSSIERRLLDHLLSESKLYKDSASYVELLEFTKKLRNVAPFNAMLLQIQKPDVTFVASAHEWFHQFERWPREDARPLLILWPFAPVATVYDVLDTEGKELPDAVAMFPARGDTTVQQIRSFSDLLRKKNVEVDFVDKGDAYAGRIILRKDEKSGESTKARYTIKMNQNHSPNVQFTTLAHELGHLFLGHLGRDKDLQVPNRRVLTAVEKEVEAESVAYIVCHRSGVTSKSQKYLANFVDARMNVEDLDIYQIMRSANAVEHALDLCEHTKFASKKQRREQDN